MKCQQFPFSLVYRNFYLLRERERERERERDELGVIGRERRRWNEGEGVVVLTLEILDFREMVF